MANQYYVQYQTGKGGAINTRAATQQEIEQGYWQDAAGRKYTFTGNAYEAARQAQTPEEKANIAEQSKQAYEAKYQQQQYELRQKREALKSNYAGTFRDEYNQRMAYSPIEASIPTRKEYAQVKYLTSPTAQWSSPEAFKEKAAMVGKYAPFAGAKEFRGQIVQPAPGLQAFANYESPFNRGLIKKENFPGSGNNLSSDWAGRNRNPFDLTQKTGYFTVIEGRIAQKYVIRGGENFGKSLFGQPQGKPEPGATYRKSMFGEYFKVNAVQPRALITEKQASMIRNTDTAAMLLTPSGAFASTSVLKGASLALKIPKSFSMPALPKINAFRETGISPKYKSSFGYMPKEQQAGMIREETIRTIRYSKPGLFRETGISPTYKPAYSYLPKTQQAEMIRSELITGRKTGIEVFRPTGKAPSYDPQYLHLSQAQRGQALKQTYLTSRKTPMQAFISSEKGQFLPLSQRQRLHQQQLKPSMKYPFQEESAPIQDYIKTWKPTQAREATAYRAASVPMLRYGTIAGQRLKPSVIQTTSQLTRQIQRHAARSIQYPIMGTGLLSGQGLRQAQLQVQLQRQVQRQIQIQKQMQIQKPKEYQPVRETFKPFELTRPKISRFGSSNVFKMKKSKKGKFGFGKFGEIARIAAPRHIMKGLSFGAAKPRRRSKKGKK